MEKTLPAPGLSQRGVRESGKLAKGVQKEKISGELLLGREKIRPGGKRGDSKEEGPAGEAEPLHKKNAFKRKKLCSGKPQREPPRCGRRGSSGEGGQDVTDRWGKSLGGRGGN